MYADDDDDDQPAVMLGFGSLDDLVGFIKWINSNFDSPEDLKEYFENQYHAHKSEYSYCERDFQKEESDFKFWDIVKNSFKNHHGDSNADLHDTD